MTAQRAVANIERHLRAIYAIEGESQAPAFLVGDVELARWMAEGLVEASVVGTDEHVFVEEAEGSAHVALYLSDAVQRALVDAPDLQCHCHAVEGVSHVLRVLWSAERGRSVSRLDLEVQAEVDKAATCLLLDHGTGGGRGAELLRRLFGHATLHDSDSGSESYERYRTAHRLGERYAWRLRALLARSVETMLVELRRFYRLTEVDRRHLLSA